MAHAVRILYFAGVRDIVGKADESFELPTEVRTVGEFRAWLTQRRPELRDALPHVRIAVDEQFAEAGAELGRNATVALIPPVAGG